MVKNNSNENMLTGEVGSPSGASETQTASTPESVYDFLVLYINMILNKTNRFDIFGLGCGTGKSQSATRLAANVLQGDWDGIPGILLVTDSVSRLEGYGSGDCGDERLRDYIERNSDRIFIYTSKNRMNRAELYSKPVIAITTQRLLSLDREELRDIIESYCPKRLLVIDERLPLSETFNVTIKTFNDVDTELHQRLDNTVNQNNKSWLIREWGNLTQRYKAIFESIEKRNTGKRLVEWFEDDDHNATTDDQRFLELTTHTYKGQLRKRYPDTVRKIQAIFSIVRDGALVVSERKTSRSSGRYSTEFIAVLDYGDLLRDLGTKVIVLDGTAANDPIYRRYDTNIIDCPQFDRDLSKLTIRIVDCNTSKLKLIPPRNRRDEETPIVTAIKDYLRASNINQIDAIFTHGELEHQFQDIATTVNHFGNLKGSNAYREATNIVQVGLFRYPPEVYTAMAIHAQRVKFPPDKRGVSIFNRETAARRIMLQSILTDLEQNIFRCAIRNPNNDKACTYTVIYRSKSSKDKAGNEHNDLADLTEMIKERFGSRGAKIIEVETPRTILALKTETRKASGDGLTAAQRIIEWYKRQPEGRTFKLSEMLDECCITGKQFDDVKRHNKYVRELFDRMKTSRKGYYHIFPQIDDESA